MASDPEYSRIVSRSLDCLGCNQDMVKCRIYMNNIAVKLDNQITEDLLHVHIILPGSKGEGLTAPFESDIDIMGVHLHVVCTDNIQPFTNMRNMTVFQTDTRETSPGYTRLKLVSLGDRYSNTEIQASLFQSESGDRYMSSDFYVKYTKQDYILQDTFYAEDEYEDISTSGPANSFSDKKRFLDDIVHSFWCFCPDLLQPWLTRPRQYGWPTPQILNDISRMEAHVVPVGFKGSDNFYKEWRICFTRAELHLIHNLNDTQIKLYILQKMVVKSIIKPVYDEITSYIVKNIVLWMSEYNPQEYFQEELLTQRLVQSLNALTQFMEANYLPNYMIPERNMLAGRLDFIQRHQIVALLSGLIDEGGSLLLRCEKLRNTMMMMCMSPHVVVEYGRRIDMLERLWCLLNCRSEALSRPGMSREELDPLYLEDESFGGVATAIVDLVVPDFLELFLQGCRRASYLCRESPDNTIMKTGGPTFTTNSMKSDRTI